MAACVLFCTLLCVCAPVGKNGSADYCEVKQSINTPVIYPELYTDEISDSNPVKTECTCN